MWDIWELSQIPTPPHKVIHADEAGWTSEDKLAFDRMILTFGGRWVEGKKNETVWGHGEEPPVKGQMRVPKYRSLADIFAEYDDTWDLSKFAKAAGAMFTDADMDAVIEAAYADDVLF